MNKEKLFANKIEWLSNELEEARESLVEQFYTDALSGLPNLYKLRATLEESNHFTLIIVNIDNFKLLNDF